MMTNILTNNRAINAVRRDTTPFGWTSFKAALLIFPITVAVTAVTVVVKIYWAAGNVSQMLPVVSLFLWISLLIACALVLDDATTKNRNQKELKGLLEELKRKGYRCDADTNCNANEILLHENDLFMFFQTSGCYVAGKYGCFYAEGDGIIAESEYLDEAYMEAVVKHLGKTDRSNNYVKAIQNGVTLVLVNDEYIIQRKDLSFEIYKEEACEIINGERELESVFKRHLRESLMKKY